MFTSKHSTQKEQELASEAIVMPEHSDLVITKLKRFTFFCESQKKLFFATKSKAPKALRKAEKLSSFIEYEMLK